MTSEVWGMGQELVRSVATFVPNTTWRVLKRNERDPEDRLEQMEEVRVV